MPYCRKCGKQIETNEELCEDCRNEEIIFGDYNSCYDYTKEENSGRMNGFGKALASCILGSVALSVLSVILNLLVYVIESNQRGSNLVGIVVLSFFMMGAVVISLIFGMNSIKTFKANIKEGKAKPIATLVCGIVGCVCSGMSILFVLIMLPLLIVT